MSTPYAVSSDLVSAYPAKSLAIAQYIDGFKTDLAMVQNAQTGTSYTFALTDFTKLLTLNNAAAVAVTLPLEATVAWPTGTQLRLLNIGAGTVTVAGAVGVTINGTPLTLAQFKGAVLIKTGTNTWTFLPFSSGVGAAVFSDTPTGTYTGYAYKTFSSGSGTLTVTKAGFADIVVVGGGGGGCTAGQAGYAAGGGGAGGALVGTQVYLPAGTLTVTVGAGGAGNPGGSASTALSGTSSRIGDYYGIGGGGASGQQQSGSGLNSFPGGSGGGAFNTGTSGAGVAGQGFAGGAGNTIAAGGGGGGAAAVGTAAASATAGGAGGAGTTTTIAGTTPTGAYVAGSYAFAGGGGGGGTVSGGAAPTGGVAGTTGAGNAGTANKGSGGGGGSGANAGGNGGSGIVIVKVAV